MYLDIEALSGVCGSVSIAAWVVVFSPQIIENFRRSSAEGLSLMFLVIWLAGDIFNILGAVLQGVLPTMTILAAYYTLADIVLILQVLYYRGFTFTKLRTQRTMTTETSDIADEPNETSALLSRDESPSRTPSAATTIRPVSTDRSNSTDATHLSPATPLHPQNRDESALKGQGPVQKQQSLAKTIVFNTTAVLVVCAAGALGWWLSTRGPGHHHSRRKAHEYEHEKGSSQHSDLVFSPLGQVFGYICAVLYLGSRAPQLLLNYRRKSTEGISMLFFIFAVIGNATYVLSILAYEPPCLHQDGHLLGNWSGAGSLKHHHRSGCRPGEAGELYGRNVLVNFSWLLGSFGTLILDAGVFWQWYIYRDHGRQAAATIEAGTQADTTAH